MPSFPRALLASLLALAPIPAGATGIEAGLRAGVSAPSSEAVTLGPSVGLGARIGLSPRYRIALAGDQSLHWLPRVPAARIDVTTLSAGLELAIDELPLLPTFALGPAVQYARRVDRDASVWVPCVYFGFGLQAALESGLRLGVQLRYLSTDFSAEGFPAFPAVALEVGWGT